MSPPQKAGSFFEFFGCGGVPAGAVQMFLFFNFTVQTLFLAHVYDFARTKI